MSSQMISCLLVTAALSCILPPAAIAYHTGAPEQACNQFTPSHGTHVAQLTDSPYAIQQLGMWESADGRKQVELELITPPQYPRFQGFMLYAMDGIGDLIGSFSTPDSQMVQYICSGTAVTHTLTWYQSQQSTLRFTWTAPPQDIFTGFITFMATFVENEATFWNLVDGGQVAIVYELPAAMTPPPGWEATSSIPLPDVAVPEAFNTTESQATTFSELQQAETSTTIPSDQSTADDVSSTLSNTTESDPIANSVSQSAQTTVSDISEEPKLNSIITGSLPEVAPILPEVIVASSDVSSPAAVEEAANVERTTVSTTAASVSDCSAGTLECLKRRIVSRIHFLVSDLENLREYISPTSVGSSSSRD